MRNDSGAASQRGALEYMIEYFISRNNRTNNAIW
jgi:hypothetical protein